MEETRNNPVQWIRYLFCLAAASVALGLLSSFTTLGGLTGWVSIAIGIASLYVLFQLAGVNSRYKKAAIFGVIGLAITQLPVAFLSLAGSICSLIGQYNEYHAHGELVADRDEKLSGKWNGLFWLQFVVTLLLSLLVGVLVVALTMIAGVDEAQAQTIINPMAVVIALALQGLYMLYLNRTIKVLESE